MNSKVKMLLKRYFVKVDKVPGHLSTFTKKLEKEVMQLQKVIQEGKEVIGGMEEGKITQEEAGLTYIQLNSKRMQSTSNWHSDLYEIYKAHNYEDWAISDAHWKMSQVIEGLTQYFDEELQQLKRFDLLEDSTSEVNEEQILKKGHILVVEDDLIDQITIQKAMRELNINNRLIMVENGEEALQYLLEADTILPELIIVDINMPQMNGIELVRSLKANPELRRIPVIMLTTSQEKQDIADVFDVSVAGYMVKPVSFQAYKALIQLIYNYWSKSLGGLSLAMD